MAEWDEADVQCFMWLVRWQLRGYGWHRQYQDMLSAAYARAWQAALSAAKFDASEVAKRVSKAALWAAADWLRSADNEGRTHARSHSRVVELPERVAWSVWERWEEGMDPTAGCKRPERWPERWVERLIAGIDAEREGCEP